MIALGVGGMAKTVDELLSEARALLPYRPSPAEALAAQVNGALLVDIRGDDQRRADGLIPGAVVVARKRAGVAMRSGVPVAGCGYPHRRPGDHRGLPGGVPVEPGGGGPAADGLAERHRS